MGNPDIIKLDLGEREGREKFQFGLVVNFKIKINGATFRFPKRVGVTIYVFKSLKCSIEGY